MTMTPKREAIQALERLPEDASYETVAERLHFIYKIQAGLADADAGRMYSYDQIRAEFARRPR